MENKAVIIGAGVGGMTLAIYLKRAGVNFSLIEEKRPGGQINFALSVENFPSYSKISGRELSSKIFEQVKELDIDYIKDKVLSYLSNCSKIYKSNHFHIPFNRQELADYLAVDRSALCATLSKLKKAKIIDYHKNNFTIFYQIL